MKKLELVNTNSQENNNAPGRYTLSSIHIGNNEADEIIQIHDEATGLNNMLNSNMELVFENWYEIIGKIKNPAGCLAVKFSDGSVNLIFPDMTLALDSSYHATDYYPAYENMIFFFGNIEGSAGNLIAYDITKRCEAYAICNVTIDNKYHTIPRGCGEPSKYFYYIDFSSNTGKVVDITTGRCVLEDAPIGRNMVINYSSDDVLLISFDSLKNPYSFEEKWLINIKNENHLILNDEDSRCVEVDYEFKFEDSNYVVLSTRILKSRITASSNLVIRIDENGKFSKITDWVDQFKSLNFIGYDRFATYYTDYYDSIDFTLYDLKKQEIAISNIRKLKRVNDDIMLVDHHIRTDKNDKEIICRKLFSISSSKFILGTKKMNITDVITTNDDDILIILINYRHYALFSISKEEIISGQFHRIGEKFNSKGYIKVYKTNGKKNFLDKNGNLVNEHWV